MVKDYLTITIWGQGQQGSRVPTYGLRAQQLSGLSPLFLCDPSLYIGWLLSGVSMLHGPQLQLDGLQLLPVIPQ